MRKAKQHAEAKGRWAERMAAWRYRLNGFRLLAERYRTPVGELDLVMRRGQLLVFIEVKARSVLEDALYALHPRQRNRLIEAAEIFLRDHPAHRTCAMRFDLIGIQPWRLPRRVVDAWRIE